MQNKPFDTVATIDAEWDARTALLLAALLKEAAPSDMDRAASLGEFVRHALWEYAEEGLSLRDVLLIARKCAGQLQVSNACRFAFVGIVSEAATSIKPRRTRTTKQGKSSHFIARESARLAHIIWDDKRQEGGPKGMQDAAVRAAQETLQTLLPEHLVPALKTIKQHLQDWRNAESVQGPNYREVLDR